jgi:Mg-chelatase subunit ChlD
MRVGVRKLLGYLLLTALLLAVISPLAAAADTPRKSYNKYNIVLVTDASGSMVGTDGSGYRFEAISKFVGMIADRGNRLGSVVFNGDIRSRVELADTNGSAVKRALVDGIRVVKPTGYTNIGLALDTAIDILDSGKDESLPSIILFMSDGNTDMPTDKEIAASKDLKADAIQRAREKGYIIHAIGLDNNGQANLSEVSQLASATGGEYEPVKLADDLLRVYDMFYKIIYKSSIIQKGEVEEFPASGFIDKIIDVPSIGVEEINIIFNGPVSGYELKDPNGKQYTPQELEDIKFSGDLFLLLKLVKPVPGPWELRAYGIEKDKISIDLVFNSNIGASLALSPDKDSYEAGERVTASVSLLEDTHPVTDFKAENFTATLHITSAGNETTQPMTASGGVFTCEYVPAGQGSVKLYATVAGEGYDEATQTLTIRVVPAPVVSAPGEPPAPPPPPVNEPPYSNGDIEVNIKLWPFKKNTATVSLLPGATDPEGQPLTFAVVSSAFNDEEYELDGSELTLFEFSLSKGSFEIIATDPEGESVTFNVLIKTTNIGLITLIALGVAVVLVLAALAVFAYILSQKRFMGSISLTVYNDNSNEFHMPIVRTPRRGKCKLSSFGVAIPGMSASSCYFQATGETQIYFKSPKPVYQGSAGERTKKVPVLSYDVRISAAEDRSSGIIVSFQSAKMM